MAASYLDATDERSELIKRLYYQELGTLSPDEAGFNYWKDSGLDESALRANMRNAAGPDFAGPSVQEPLLADQTYAAYLRNMQFDESQIQSSLDAAKTAAANRITGQAGIYTQQRDDSQDALQSGYESRGMQRSGGRLKDIADSRADIDYNENVFKAGVTDSVTAASDEAAASVARLRRERAEQEIAARDRLTERSVKV